MVRMTLNIQSFTYSHLEPFDVDMYTSLSGVNEIRAPGGSNYLDGSSTRAGTVAPFDQRQPDSTK